MNDFPCEGDVSILPAVKPGQSPSLSSSAPKYPNLSSTWEQFYYQLTNYPKAAATYPSSRLGETFSALRCIYT